MKYLLQVSYPDAPNLWETYSFYSTYENALYAYRDFCIADAKKSIDRTWRIERQYPRSIADLLVHWRYHLDT